MPLSFLELQFDVDPGRKIESLERVHRLRRRIDDVEQPLVRAHLEVLARVLVLMRRPDDRVDRTLRGERDRTVDARARTSHRLDDLLCALVDDLVIVGLQPDPNLHSGCQLVSSPFPFRFTAPAERFRSPTSPPRRRRVLLAIFEKIAFSLKVLCSKPRPGVSGPVDDSYSVIFTTRPAPTVRPPSRMAKRSPSSMAIGWPSSTDISVLSPGMTISVPSGSLTAPVTSVVRK